MEFLLPWRWRAFDPCDKLIAASSKAYLHSREATLLYNQHPDTVMFVLLAASSWRLMCSGKSVFHNSAMSPHRTPAFHPPPWSGAGQRSQAHTPYSRVNVPTSRYVRHEAGRGVEDFASIDASVGKRCALLVFAKPIKGIRPGNAPSIHLLSHGDRWTCSTQIP